MKFDEHQTNAINNLVNSGNKLLVLTGTPGAGKSTILRELIHTLPNCLTVLCCAPSGKAAKILEEMLSKDTGITPTTIHRMLGCRGPGMWEYDADNKLEADVVIVDESSMVGSELLAKIIDGVSVTAKIILVGDMNQLPPVPAGCPFFDICTKNNPLIVNRLVRNFRQIEGSLIADACDKVLRQKEILFGHAGQKTLGGTREDDLFLEDIEDKELIPARIYELCQKWHINKLDYQILSPQHSGVCGVESLNTFLQKKLNPQSPGKPEMKISQFLTLRLGDKVINKKNNYKLNIFNGYVGVIISIGRNELTVNFDGLSVEIDKEGLRNLRLAYCLTIHASQGSEYQNGIVVCHSSHYFMLSNSLLYVAVSRFKNQLHIIGNKKGLKRAIGNKKTDARQTYLQNVL